MLRRRGIHVHPRLVGLIVSWCWDQLSMRPPAGIWRALTDHRKEYGKSRPKRDRTAERLAEIYPMLLLTRQLQHLEFVPPKPKRFRTHRLFTAAELAAAYRLERRLRRRIAREKDPDEKALLEEELKAWMKALEQCRP